MENELPVEDDVLSDLEEQLIELEIHPINNDSDDNNESEDDDQDHCITAGHVWILYVLSINLFCAINVIG